MMVAATTLTTFLDTGGCGLELVLLGGGDDSPEVSVLSR
jgi:hypothetical protein